MDGREDREILYIWEYLNVQPWIFVGTALLKAEFIQMLIIVRSLQWNLGVIP